ncbi:MAG: hypothetical protein AMXMBFR58_31980 [Phycisphaerae bacterium]
MPDPAITDLDRVAAASLADESRPDGERDARVVGGIDRRDDLVKPEPIGQVRDGVRQRGRDDLNAEPAAGGVGAHPPVHAALHDEPALQGVDRAPADDPTRGCHADPPPGRARRVAVVGKIQGPFERLG